MSEPRGEGVYRETVDRIGTSEREDEAVRVFGAWRDRTKARVLAAFGVLGLIPAALAYYLAQEWQLEHNGGVAFARFTAALAGAVWFASFLAGAFAGRLLVRRRTPARLAELAKAYEVPVASLAQIAAVVDRL